jgi:hypothetical protein
VGTRRRGEGGRGRVGGGTEGSEKEQQSGKRWPFSKGLEEDEDGQAGERPLSGFLAPACILSASSSLPLIAMSSVKCRL